MTPNDPRHGTLNGYGNLGCRCERCREASREDYQARAIIMRIALAAVRCPMCRLGIFPGHGHKRREGTVIREATIRWAA